MRILVSAYACEPARGSEPGIGWNWALNLEKLGHEVTVLTRRNNRPRIEDYLLRYGSSCHLKFVYYDLPKSFQWMKRRGILPVQLYYAFWQFGCVGAVKAERPDFIWHLTFGGFRQPSFLWMLKAPLVFGPVGGGERAPLRMRSDYHPGGMMADAARDILNFLARFDPFLLVCVSRARLILTKTSQTLELLPTFVRHRAKVSLEIGIDADRISTAGPQPLPVSGLRLLFVGRFIYWKGVSLAIRAFAAALRLGSEGRLTLVGKGPEEQRARALAEELGVAALIDWIPWMEQSALRQVYAAHDCFLFPSLHDSSGNVVLEAMASGLPVVCLDLGGPAEIVTTESGVVVSTTGADAAEACERMGRELKLLADNPARLSALKLGAERRARQFVWPDRVSEVLGEVRRTLEL